jgi:hypothetical protein
LGRHKGQARGHRKQAIRGLKRQARRQEKTGMAAKYTGKGANKDRQEV